MKSRRFLIGWLVLPIAFLQVSCQTTPLPPGIGDSKCEKVAEKGFINILTINLLFSEIEDRNDRLEAIADFAATHDVDVLMLQEVVNGALVKTDNSAQDLRDILSNKHNLGYNIQTAFEIGLPGLLSVANGVLSRCEIRYNLVQRLPKTPEIEFNGHVFEVSRNVVLSRLEIPDSGKISVYNTHLCADCEESERAQQVEVLLEFLSRLEENAADDYPTILAGDFNFDRFRNHGAQRFQYEQIVNAGFIDAYAEYIIVESEGRETLDTICEDEDNPDEHCTTGVSQLNGPKSRRKDYIFTRGFADVRFSKIVFNTLVNETEPTVSDHAGVFIRLGLP
jgi:maltose 6'-phosphate phosphatase